MAMKRSRKITLVLLGGVASGALAGCEDPAPTAVYADVPSCIRDGQPEGVCRSSFAEAEGQHAAVAPKYASTAECETDFGPEQCRPVDPAHTNGGVGFMPFFAGYLLAGGGRVAAQPAYRGYDPATRRYDGLYTASGTRLSPAFGRTSVYPSNASRPSATRSMTVSRGGFGATGRAMSGGGLGGFGG